MLGSKSVIATIAVRDLEKSKSFYEGKLGLKAIEGEKNTYTGYKAGETTLFVYQSQYAGGYKATVATWLVGDDLENIVTELKKKGVPFEDYGDMPGLSHSGDIYKADDMAMGWFKDPDGNIICLVSGQK